MVSKNKVKLVLCEINLTRIVPSWSISLLPNLILSHMTFCEEDWVLDLESSLPYFFNKSSSFCNVDWQSATMGASCRPHSAWSRLRGDSGALTSYFKCRRTVKRLLTSREISSYSCFKISEVHSKKLRVYILLRWHRDTFCKDSYRKWQR